MKLAISNIGWNKQDDGKVYEIMKKRGFSGLEIAPTRIFPETPYNQLEEAGAWKKELEAKYGFSVPSMQSIWYGRNEKIFGSAEERHALMAYTRQAVDFAQAIGCSNLVFGCPKNRNVPNDKAVDLASFLHVIANTHNCKLYEAPSKRQSRWTKDEFLVTVTEFFRELGDYAYAHDCIIALEANPPIYGTNFINRTKEAIEFAEFVGSRGLRVNLDVGTMIENGETVDLLGGKEHLIHHVHISEPGLKPLQKRQLHRELADWLRNMGYPGFVSIETGTQADLNLLEAMMDYVADEFG